MYNRFILLACFTIVTVVSQAQTPGKQNYVNSRAPLRQNAYLELPLGTIKPQGWLKEMLIRQKNGATGNLDKLYPVVMNERNGWLGGDGDQWERGPYWIDGLLPLAYILDDNELIAKTKPWVEWAIKSQQTDGYFGPSKDYPEEAGVQRDNSRDWWPKMVVLKILKQYYSATNDKRVITLMTNYFKYQLKELPKTPLDHWTYWAKFRAGDNLAVVYWLYNITGDKFLLELGDLLHKQTFDYTGSFLNTDLLSKQGSIHCVNLAQGMKEPAIYYQHHPEQKYLDAMKKGFSDLKKYNGMAHGLYGGDEPLHGNNPTQGSELCSAVEMMFTLESSLEITGNVDYADHLEKIAFNALPAQVSDDYMSRQYFQQANQVMATRHMRNFGDNHGGTDLCYGLLSGYPCCTSNMHQGWPKFTQNLWYATADKGLAALVYSPNEVKALVADGTEVSFREETNYPFEESIRFTYSTNEKTKQVTFPFHLRIPAWCKEGVIKINGKEFNRFYITNKKQLNIAVEIFFKPPGKSKSIWDGKNFGVQNMQLSFDTKTTHWRYILISRSKEKNIYDINEVSFDMNGEKIPLMTLEKTELVNGVKCIYATFKELKPLRINTFNHEILKMKISNAKKWNQSSIRMPIPTYKNVQRIDRKSGETYSLMYVYI